MTSSGPRILKLHFDTPAEKRLAAITFFGVLAFPEDSIAGKKFIRACWAVMLRENTPVNSKKWKSLEPWVRKYPARALYDNGPITKACSRLPWRLLVADTALALMANIMFEKSRMPIEVSCNQVRITNVSSMALALSRAGGKESGSENDTYIIRKWWKETKPVLHLALALRGVTQEQGSRLSSAQDMFRLFYKPDWLPTAIRMAELYRAFPQSIPELRIDPSVTIEISFADSAKKCSD